MILSEIIQVTDLFPDMEILLFFAGWSNFRQLFSLNPAVNYYGNERINLGRIFRKRITLADL